MFGHPRFDSLVVYAGCSTTLFILAWFLSPTLLLVGALCAGLGFVFAAATVVYSFYFWMDNRETWMIRRIDAENNTADVRLVDALSRLSPEGYDALMHAENIQGLGKLATRTLWVKGEEIPIVFIHQVVNHSPDYLPPIRDYRDGTRERRWLKALIEAWKDAGFISVPGLGVPYPASWVNRDAALRMIGYTED